MPKYSMTRKLNLGRYGMQFESIDLGVSDCDSKEEAEREIKHWEYDVRKNIWEKMQVKKQDNK